MNLEFSCRHHAHSGLVKKMKKEIGETDSVSLRYLRQLLPLPKLFDTAITCETFGTVTDNKGNKVKGFNMEKKHGLQVRLSKHDCFANRY